MILKKSNPFIVYSFNVYWTIRILVSYTVPKLAVEKPSLNTEERLFQVEIIARKRKYP